MRNHTTTILVAILYSFFQFGCQSFGRSSTASVAQMTERQGVTFTEGRPRPVVDTVGWVFGIPEKILLWDSRVANHKISDETEESVATYLNSRGLNDVHVRVNEYAPVGEWQRLKQNHSISPGWRYTVGVLSVAGYTLVPGRIFGGDRYNPYTNSLYVYSDVPSLGFVSGAYALDIHHRNYPGTYAVSQEFPILSMYKETLATNEAIDYLRFNGKRSEVYEGYRILYPRYGKLFGGAMDSIVSVGSGGVFEIAGAVVGQAAGRWKGHPWLESSRSERSKLAKSGEPENDQVTTRAQSDENSQLH